MHCGVEPSSHDPRAVRCEIASRFLEKEQSIREARFRKLGAYLGGHSIDYAACG